ncbi:MAG: hypothetical protein ACFFG0_12240 [Candidatus Thorarchaeota archaeon]
MVKFNHVDQLIWDDINQEINVCPNCHTNMKQRKFHIDSWYCPNPKCKGGNE